MEGLIRAGALMGCAVAVTLVVACNGKPSAPTPVEEQWTENGERFLIKGSTDVSGSAIVYEGICSLSLQHFPKGTFWQALGKRGTARGDDSIDLVDVGDKIGDLPVDPEQQRKAQFDPRASIVFDFLDGRQATVKLPPATMYLEIEKTLQKIEHGPVVFGQEVDDGKPARNVYYIAATPAVFGPATTLRDIDAIAVATRLPDAKGTKKCSYTDTKALEIDLQLREV